MDGVVSPRTAHRDRPARRCRVLNLEACGPGTPTPIRFSKETSQLDDSTATNAHAGALRRAIQARAHRRAIQQVRTPASPPRQPHAQRVNILPRCWRPASIFRHQGHGRQCRACLQSRRAAELKEVIGDLDVPVIVGGCASFSTALHLMRTAPGLLVGVGPARPAPPGVVLGVGVPMATAIADAAGARMRYLTSPAVATAHPSPTAGCVPAVTSPRPSSAAPMRS